MVGKRMAPRLAAMILAGLVCGIVLTGAARAQGSADLARLRAHVSSLHSEGRYAEAIPIAEQVVALARKLRGEDHMEFASATAWLALVYQAQGRYRDAEPLYRRSLAITEKARVGASRDGLARLYQGQGLHGEAEPSNRRRLAIVRCSQ